MVRSGYKQTDVGEVPDTWDVVTLGDHVRFLRSVPLSRAQLDSASPIRYLHYGDIHTRASSSLDAAVETMPRVPGGLAGRADDLQVGDLVFADASEDEAGVAKAVEVVSVPEQGVVAGLHTIAARLDPTVFARGYGGFLQYSPWFREGVLRLASGTKVLAIQRSQLASLRLPVPPLREQRAIAEVLGDTDGLLGALDRLLAKKRASLAATVAELLSGARQAEPGSDRTRYQTELGLLPSDWRVVPMGDVVRLRAGGTPATGNARYYGGGIPWASISDMTSSGRYVQRTQRTLSQAGLDASAAVLYPQGTILYAMYASLGEVAVCSVQMTSSQAILGIEVGPGLVRDFLYYVLLGMKPQVAAYAQQGTQANLSKDIVSAFPIPIPPVKVQRAIAGVLSDMDDEIDALAERRSKTVAVKLALMDELLTGRMRLV